MVIIVALVLIVGGVAVFGISRTKPETPAQARQRLYREAAARDRQMHKIEQDVYQRMQPGRKRQPYRPNKRRIQRYAREIADGD